MRAEPLKLTRDERIRAWKADRLAEAEAGRLARVAALDAGRPQRLEEARKARAESDAAAASQRQEAALRRLAGLEDLGFAAEDLRRAERRRNRATFSRLAVFIGGPVLAALAWASLAATDIYRAETRILLSGPVMGQDDPAAAAYAFAALATSPEMMEALEAEGAYLAQFESDDTDALNRVRDVPALGRDRLAWFRRFVQLTFDPETRQLTLITHGRSPANAESAARLILALAEDRLAPAADGPEPVAWGLEPAGPRTLVTLVGQPVSPTYHPALSKTKFVLFSGMIAAALYAILSVFASSFLHYGRR